MKLAILSRNSKLYSTRRLVEAARERGHTVRVLDPLRCYMRISSEDFSMHHQGKPMAGYHAVVPRIGASVTRYGTAVLRQFELMGSYTPNPSDAILKARDKLRCHQLMAAQGLGLPVTVFGDNPDDTADLLSLLGPPPHVIKLNEGTQGAGGDADRKAFRLAQRDRSAARPLRELPGAGVRRRGQGRRPALFRGRRQGRGGDAADGAEGRLPLQPASRRHAPRRSRPPRPSRTPRSAPRACWGWGSRAST